MDRREARFCHDHNIFRCCTTKPLFCPTCPFTPGQCPKRFGGSGLGTWSILHLQLSLANQGIWADAIFWTTCKKLCLSHQEGWVTHVYVSHVSLSTLNHTRQKGETPNQWDNYIQNFSIVNLEIEFRGPLTNVSVHIYQNEIILYKGNSMGFFRSISMIHREDPLCVCVCKRQRD